MMRLSGFGIYMRLTAVQAAVIPALLCPDLTACEPGECKEAARTAHELRSKGLPTPPAGPVSVPLMPLSGEGSAGRGVGRRQEEAEGLLLTPAAPRLQMRGGGEGRRQEEAVNTSAVALICL